MIVRILDLRLFFMGAVIGFLYCVLQGHLLSHENYLRHFKRFHTYIAPETHYYPTIRQMRGLAESYLNHADNKQAVLVIIGGSSIMNGVGQDVDHLWTDRLQSLLGNNYCVINLAMHGSSPTAGAECIAEYFLKAKRPVIFVGDVGGPGLVSPDGGPTYRYQFWQAYEAGLLLPNPQRLAAAYSDLPLDEQPLQAKLNEYLRFDETWSYISYDYFNTVWPGLTYPRWAVSDDEESRRRQNPFENTEIELPIVRSFSQSAYKLNAQGHWEEIPQVWNDFGQSYATAFLPEVRSHTLLVRTQNAPYIRNLLPASEKERDLLAVDGTVHHLTALGFKAVGMGDEFLDDDFHDRCHLAPSGGEKLAALTAPVILSMGQQLYGIAIPGQTSK